VILVADEAQAVAGCKAVLPLCAVGFVRAKDAAVEVRGWVV
jgi:hypothetical protein